MQFPKVVHGCTLLLALALGGCNDRPTAVEPEERLRAGEPAFDHTTPVEMEVPVLERVEPLRKDLQAVARIGPDGGEVKIKDAGISVHFPKGAVTELTEVRLVARAGKALIYEFYPSPRTFDQLVKVEVDLRPTTAYRNTELMQKLRGAYYPGDGAAEYGADGTVFVTELLPVELEVKTSKIKFFVHHFSGYLVAVG